MPSSRSRCAHQRADRAVRPYNQSRRGDPCGRPPGLVPHFIQCVIAKPVRPPGLYRIFYNVSLRGRNAPVAIRVPRPKAPLPKGGWHGEAVTGGVPLSTPLVTDAGRCGHRPLRNSIGKPSVGADASVRPPTTHRTPGRARGPCPTKMPCRAGPMCPAAHRTPCNVSLRSQCAHWLWQSVL